MNKYKHLWVVLPHRGLDAGKTRLAAVLDESARSTLNRWLLLRTLRIASEWLGDPQRCVVVSPCLHTLALAGEAGAVALHEHMPAAGLNAALAQGAAKAAGLGAQRLLILPCDLPRLDIAALQAMAALSISGVDTVIAPDRHDNGTNALLVDACVREFAFGENSLARHGAMAAARGIHVSRCMQPALAFDLDTVDDFSQWLDSGDAAEFLAAQSLPA